MSPRETSQNHSHLTVPQNQIRLVFERMNRSIGSLAKSLTPKNVHHFRTNSRRIEAVIDTLAPQSRNKKKVLKLVGKLRKRAGKLRDIDVQIAFLKNLKVPDRQGQRAHLLEVLDGEHARRVKKLNRAVDPSTLRELRKRLRREQAEVKLDGVDPLRLAAQSLPKLDHAPLTEQSLHAYRIAAKQARYLAELAGETPAAKTFVDELTRVQDAAGEWHDAMKLKEKAAKRFGGASESALVSMLQNISRARFRNASNSLTAAITAISRNQHANPVSDVQNKKTASDDVAASRAVA